MRANTLSLIGFGLLAVGGSAGAASLLGTTTNPTGFTGLMVGGASYDAIFSIDSYNRLFTGTAPPPIFASNPANAFLAESPLSTLLTAAGVTGLGGVPCALRSEACMIFIPTTTYTSPLGKVTTNGAFVEWNGAGWSNGAGDPGLEVSAPGGDAVENATTTLNMRCSSRRRPRPVTS